MSALDRTSLELVAGVLGACSVDLGDASEALASLSPRRKTHVYAAGQFPEPWAIDVFEVAIGKTTFTARGPVRAPTPAEMVALEGAPEPRQNSRATTVLP